MMTAFIFFCIISSGLAAALLFISLRGRKAGISLRLTAVTLILGLSSILMSLIFFTLNLGKPARVFYLLSNPNFSSLSVWVIIILLLCVFLILLLIFSFFSFSGKSGGLDARLSEQAATKKIKALTWLTALPAMTLPILLGVLHQGSLGNPGSLDNMHSPVWTLLPLRFLASAISCGPALLLLVFFLLNRFTRLRLDIKFVKFCASCAAYALGANILLYLLEIFNAFYNVLPEQMRLFTLLFGCAGPLSVLNIVAWLAAALALLSFLLLALPHTRRNMRLLPWSLTMLLFYSVLDLCLIFNA